ncbi:MAG: PIN domain-containing protein [Candidatus Electrothrix sp. MAN1_4]|nr:PIN domain-containing protein [Candidatus Electrothrix sp. MAN1_4]
MKIYLDNCCLNRPFDDQSNLRIHLESEAVKAILSLCEQQQWHLVSSNIMKFEIANTPDEARRKRLDLISGLTESVVRPDSATGLRAKKFEQKGLQAIDALHLACAEEGADVFLTVDDKLLKRALKIADIKIPVSNPLKWLVEVFS